MKNGSASLTCDPKGLFNVGGQSYFSNGASMCSFTSASQATACGYNQTMQSLAPSMAALPENLQNTGSCACSAANPWYVTPGLFRIGDGALYSDGASLCAFPTWQSFIDAGFNQYEYNNAKQVAAKPSQLSYTGACTANPWSGPTTKLTWVDGRPKFSIDGTNYDPFFLSVTPGAAMDYELQMAKSSGIPIVLFHMGWTGYDLDVENYAKSLKNGPYYVMIGIPLGSEWFTPIGMGSPYNGEPATYTDLEGKSAKGTTNSFNQNFVNYHAELVRNVMRRFDELLPGRVIGYQTNEQFEQPQEMQSNGTLASSAAMLTSYYSNYDERTLEDFCAWPSLPSLLKSNCKNAKPSLRNAANYGDNFIQVLDNNSALAINYNLFFASHYASLLQQYGAAVHNVSGHKALASTYYGYTNALPWDFSSTGHGALSQMEQSGQIDMIGGPYSYLDSRNAGTDMRSSGVSDSAALYNRLYLYEDDTRTYFCAQNPACNNSGFFGWYQNQAAGQLSDTLAFMRRDIVSAAVHKAGTYLLDLTDGSSLTNASQPQETTTFWNDISQDLTTAAKVSFTTQNDYEPQVAVFVDELSMLRQPLTGSSKSSDYDRMMNTTIGSLQELNKAGVVYRQYLLSDLLSDKIPLDHINVAIFLNAYQVSPEIQAAITTKLQKNGKSLFYIYAAGLFAGPKEVISADYTAIEGLKTAGNANLPGPPESISTTLSNLLPPAYASSATASTNYMSTLTGITIERGSGALKGPITTQIQYPINGTTPAPFGITDGDLLDPWFYVSDPEAVSLGHYTNNNQTSLVWKGFNGYSVFYSALPMVPAAFYRSVAISSGTHLFTDHLMDEVEAGGNTLVVNVKDTQTRTISLPFTVNQIVEDRDGVTTVKCTQCSEFTVPNMVGPSTYTYRWE